MRLRALIILAVMVMPLVHGCLFQARDADPPGTPEDDVVIALDDAAKVFAALKKSLETLLSSNYERALKFDFVFKPLAVDEADPRFDATVWADWTKDVELSIVQQMFGDYSLLDVEFEPEEEVNQEDYVRFRVDYTLRTIRVDAPGDTVTYAAIAWFDVRNDGGNWRLERWEEIEQKAVPGGGFFASWGFLKATTRQQLIGG